MRLLNRTIKNYLLYSVLLLFLCTPLFYISIQRLFIREMDKVLISHKKDFNSALDYLKTEEDLNLFQLMNKEFILIPVEHPIKNDSLYTIELYDSTAMESVPHRVFSTGATINSHAYELQVRESLVSNKSLIAAIMLVQFIMLSLLLIGLVLINRKLSKAVWGPFYVILERLKQYQIDEGSMIEFPRTTTAEFRDLSVAIDQLVQRNHAAYVSQKEFTENASHEIQTPLAICRTKLELLAQTNELTKEQADLVGELFDGMDRITRLNKSLLLLTKIENRQFIETENLRLVQVVAKLNEVYRRQATEKNLVISTDVDSSAVINANPILLEVLVTNLLSNAIRYTPASGNVMIKASDEYFSISNDGQPLEHPEKIFQRFHRESRTTPGIGLGLSIVMKICEVSDYQINYSYSSSQHHFVVRF